MEETPINRSLVEQNLQQFDAPPLSDIPRMSLEEARAYLMSLQTLDATTLQTEADLMQLQGFPDALAVVSGEIANRPETFFTSPIMASARFSEDSHTQHSVRLLYPQTDMTPSREGNYAMASRKLARHIIPRSFTLNTTRDGRKAYNFTYNFTALQESERKADISAIFRDTTGNITDIAAYSPKYGGVNPSNFPVIGKAVKECSRILLNLSSPQNPQLPQAK